MNSFSVKESLIKLREKKYNINIDSTLDLLIENYDEEQIRNLSKYHGLKIDNGIIRLFFIENVGFRCINDKSDIYGKLPICRNIEEFMNNLYLKSFQV